MSPEELCANAPELLEQVKTQVQLLQHFPSEPSQTVTFDANSTVPQVTTKSVTQIEPGLVIADRYRLQQLIGEGGMGSVWMAEQMKPVKRQVALKVILHGRNSTQVVRRFEAERQALALMDHTNIARIYDGGISELGDPYFVMELVQGVPLTRYCDDHRLKIPQRLELLVTICQAVQHAHQKGIIHRDLKPGNILVTEVDGKPVPKVIDFGVAKATERQLTEETLNDAGAVVGTPAYMSPEQADPDSIDIDTRTDVYSLGVIMYELLTGALPIDTRQLKRGGWIEMLRMVREFEPPKLSTKLSSVDNLANIAAFRNTEPAQLAKAVRGDLDWIVQKSLEKDRDRRYETANGLAEEMKKHLANQPISAGPPSRLYRFKKFVKRNEWAVIASSVIAVVLFMGVVGTVWQMFRAFNAEAKAVEERDNKDQALKTAEKRLAQVKKGSTLLNSVLHSINLHAEEKGGKTIVEQLKSNLRDASSQLLNDEIADAETVAQIQNSLGVSLLQLEDPRTAISVLQKCYETTQSYLGSNHQDTLTSLSNLALAYEKNGDFEKAVDLHRTVLEKRKEVFEVDHPEVLRSMVSLGIEYDKSGQSALALPLLEEAYVKLTQRLGPTHHDSINALQQLAWVFHSQGQWSKALSTFEKAHTLISQKYDPDHLTALESLSNLAYARRDVGQLSRAITDLEAVVTRYSAKLGQDHAMTLSIQSGLGRTYLETGQEAKGIAILERAVEKLKVGYGENYPGTLTSMNMLATAYRKAGKLDQAIPLFEDTLKRRVQKLGVDHKETLTTKNNLALAYLDAGAADKGAKLLLETIEAKTKLSGDRDPELHTTKINLGTAYLSLGQPEKAILVLQQTLDALPADHPNLLKCMNNLGNAYMMQNRVDDAVVLLEKTLKLTTDKFGPTHPATINSIQNLAGCYWKQRKLDRSIPLFEQALASLMQRYGNANTSTLLARANLAVNLRDAGRLAEAASHADLFLLEHRKMTPINQERNNWFLQEAVGIYFLAARYQGAEALLKEIASVVKQKYGNEDLRYAGTLVELGLMLLKQEKYDEAEPVLREGLAIREKKSPREWTTANARSLLGGAYLGKKMIAKAEPLLLSGYEEMKLQNEKMPLNAKVRLVEAIDRLIQLYTLANKPDEVKKWQTERTKYSNLSKQ